MEWEPTMVYIYAFIYFIYLFIYLFMIEEPFHIQLHGTQPRSEDLLYAIIHGIGISPYL